MTTLTCLLFFMTGALASFFFSTILRLIYDLNKHDNALKRSIFRTFMINAAIMLVAIFFYFTVQTLQYSGIECTTGWLARVLSINTANFICLLTLPCFAVITVSLASMRPVDFRGLLLSQLPIVFFLIAYIITGSITVIHCCQAYAALYYIMVQVVSLRQVIRYQEQIRQTYSNLTERELWWAIAYKVPIAIMFFFWSYAVSQNHPLYISIFEAGTMIFVAVYVRKIELQNYQMEEMSVIDATQPMPVPEGETDVTEQHLDPLLGKQIEQYCVGQRAFTNPDLSVGDVVKAVGSNRNYVSRWFNEQGGNFNTYINDLRIKEAEMLLRTSDHSIEDIGMETGFNNTHTFSRVFRNKYGCTPKQYRLHIT